jgi:LysM repeat protein
MTVSARTGTVTPSQLINAVNNFRLAYGLPPLAVHPVLMQVAQIEANGIAGGAGGHWRPNGLTLGQWLISLGYPLSGDLSLDGYRSENWVVAETADQAIEFLKGDEPHLNTMLSTNRSDIGAGVAVGKDGQVYCVIETALQTSSGKQQGQASTILTNVPGTQVASSNGIPEYIIPVTISTARPDGDVFHTVQFGQSLWSIAIKYRTTIKNIQALNNLGNDLVVYEGQKLLVLKEATQPPPATPTIATSTPTLPIGTMLPTITPTYAMPTIAFPPTATTKSPDKTANPSSSRILVMVLIIAAFLGAGMAVWLIREPNG